MLWFSNREDEKDRRGRLARRLHELWLTRALTGSTGPARVYPHIPTRAVADGGFSVLVETPDGRAWAESWWRDALEQVD